MHLSSEILVFRYFFSIVSCMSTELHQLGVHCPDIAQYVFERLKEEFDPNFILPDSYQDVELCAGKSLNREINELQHDNTDAQSDQSLHLTLEEALGPWLPIECTAKTLISDQTGQMPRLISVFTGAHAILLVLTCCGSNKVGIRGNIWG